MRKSRRSSSVRPLLVASAAATALVTGGLATPSAATPIGRQPPPTAQPAASRASGTAAADAVRRAAGRTPELSETTRLADRRSLVVGDRFYAMGTEDGLYPAMGFHTRGEMAGFWTPPIKLLDGIWFGLDRSWLGADVKAQRFTSGWGYTRIDYRASGMDVERTDFVPDGVRAGLVGMKVTAARDRTVRLTVDAHSELMNVYPWGETTPNQLAYNLPDTAARSGNALLFREVGTPPVRNAERHDYAAMVGSSVAPRNARTGRAFRGPQDPPVVCPASGPNAPTQPKRCDDTAYGKGAGGQLSYDITLKAGRPTSIWFAVAGSDRGVAEAQAAHRAALRHPEKLLAAKLRDRRALARRTVVDLPGDRLLQRSVEWYKQNLADSRQESRGLRLRSTNAGVNYPAPAGTLDRARWLGAGWPDYPWIFGTDGEYTAFAAVAAGQFDTIKAHLRALRDVSDVINQRSGKVVHEVTPDGSVFFGDNSDPGNTDETSKFPSAVALLWRWTGDDAFRDDLYDFSVRGMRYIVRTLDEDGDGWLEGLGNVERLGMGDEKLDNTVYTIRGLRDVADLARSKGDAATERWASGVAGGLERRFEATWWYGGDTRQYADSIDLPTGEGGSPRNDNTKIFQRHWIGVTPMDALLVRPGRTTRPLATDAHGNAALDEREQNCYTGPNGLYHTGTGPTSAEGGNKGPSCDSVVSSVQSERNIYSLNTAIMAVAEGNFGRLGERQQQHYTDANARIQLDPRIWEMPGASPEVAPGGDFGANIDRLFTERSMVLQAWGAYGVLWPVVAQQLGVDPDLGRDRVAVVPQIPAGQSRIAGRNIRLGSGSIDVTAKRSSQVLRTEVSGRLGADLTVGHVLPRGTYVREVQLDGERSDFRVRYTARGAEVLVDAGRVRAAAVQLTVRLTTDAKLAAPGQRLP